jgi:hypothetical protein
MRHAPRDRIFMIAVPDVKNLSQSVRSVTIRFKCCGNVTTSGARLRKFVPRS